MSLWTQFLKYENDIVYNDANSGLRKLCVGLSGTFYFWGGETREKRIAIANCFDVFERMFRDRLEWVLPNEDVSRRAVKIGDKKATPSIREYVTTMHPDDQLDWRLSGGRSVDDASDCYIAVLGTRHWQTTGKNAPLSWLNFAMPVEAVFGPGGQPKLFSDFLRFCCEELRPWNGNAGLASLLPQDKSESLADEFDIQQRYFGLDVVASGFYLVDHLQKALKGVNWLTFFDEDFPSAIPQSGWAALREMPGIQVWRAGCTYVLQAGDQPTLGPVPDGIPQLYKVVSDVIRGMRLTPMPSFHTGSMTGEIHFNGRTSELWSRRFDAPGIWPPYPDQIEFHKVDDSVDEYSVESSLPGEQHPPADLPPRAAVLSALPGQPCPRGGEWFNHFLKKTVHVESGEPMPGPEVDGNGNGIVWFLREG
ncbi:type VI immunity family protein [Paraburkholderia caffeinilytica]|uniref:type VI immunity family protein n=1 Tax=Paraburkholderia caffeinilytica TaxID=1761016 RepID=UPI003DA1C6D1